MNNLAFRMMSFFIKRMKKPAMVDTLLSTAGISPGQVVLDYACGPGVFTVPTAQRVGDGRVFAADMQPLAKNYIQKAAHKAGVSNISVLITDGVLDIPDHIVDTVLLFDCIHMLKNRGRVLSEIHRVLKPGGHLAVDVHHMDPAQARTRVEDSDMFKLVEEVELHEKHADYLFLFAPN